MLALSPNVHRDKASNPVSEVGLRPTTNPAVTVTFKSAENVEDQLRHATQMKRIRVSEFFKDFDPLRSGYITSKKSKLIS